MLRWPLRGAAVAAVLLALGLAFAGEAAAKSFSLPQASVVVSVKPDGSLAVQEFITFAFDGPFSGAYRDIPLRQGEVIQDAYVEENGQRYPPGASAELGSSGAPGTFGTTAIEDGFRIVWHFSALSEVRTFTVGYTLVGVAVAYDDVVDVNLRVWGDQWDQSLERLTAVMVLPGPATGSSYRVWGHPVSVRGDVQRQPQQAELRAVHVPPHQFVELRVVFPRSLLSSSAGAKVRHEVALPRIVYDEQQDARAFEHDQKRIRSALNHLPRTILILLAAALLPGLAIVGAAYWFFGRERVTGYDREYEQEPPSDLAPALVPPLLRQSPTVGSLEFTATLFDLIRRGRYKAAPVTTERSVWGGLRHEEIADLELSRGENAPLLDYEDAVASVIDAILTTGPERLSHFRDRITQDREENSQRFKD